MERKTESGTDVPKGAHRTITDLCNMRVGDTEHIIIKKEFNILIFSLLFGQLSDDPLRADVRVGLDAVLLTESVFKAELFSLLERLDFVCSSDQRLWKGKYERIRQFKHSQERVDVLYVRLSEEDKSSKFASNFFGKRGPGSRFVGFQLKLYAPSDQLIEGIDRLFIVEKPKLSSVEIAFDFFCDDPQFLQQYLETIVFLRYQRKPSWHYQGPKTTTFYATDLRKGVKGLKTYLHEGDGEEFLRMELTLKRNVLRRHGLNLLSDLPKIRDLDLSKFFGFRAVDYEKLLRFLVRREMKKLYQEDKSLVVDKVKAQREKDLLEDQLRGALRDFVRNEHEDCIRDRGKRAKRECVGFGREICPRSGQSVCDKGERSLMGQAEILKQAKIQFHRFLKEVDVESKDNPVGVEGVVGANLTTEN